MLTPRQLADAFGRNADVIRMQAAGLAHADSVRQLASRGNCLNWVVGHIVEGRNDVLELVGSGPVLDPAGASRYAYQSAPVLADGPDIVPLEDLLAALDKSQETLAVRLAALTDEECRHQITLPSRTTTLGERLFYLYFHETYHTGQTEPLRQLAGTDDAVI